MQHALVNQNLVGKWYRQIVNLYFQLCCALLSVDGQFNL